MTAKDRFCFRQFFCFCFLEIVIVTRSQLRIGKMFVSFYKVTKILCTLRSCDIRVVFLGQLSKGVLNTRSTFVPSYS